MFVCFHAPVHVRVCTLPLHSKREWLVGPGILSTADSQAHQEPPFHPCVWSVAQSAPIGGPGPLLCVWGMCRPLALSAAPSLSPNSPSLSPALCSAYRRCEAALPSPPGLLNYCQPLACLYCTAKKAAPQRQRERERECWWGEGLPAV